MIPDLKTNAGMFVQTSVHNTLKHNNDESCRSMQKTVNCIHEGEEHDFKYLLN